MRMRKGQMPQMRSIYGGSLVWWWEEWLMCTTKNKPQGTSLQQKTCYEPEPGLCICQNHVATVLTILVRYPAWFD